jgi:hypothetical protein
MRLGATLGSISQGGKVDLAMLFERHSDSLKLASADADESRKKKAK